MKILSSCYKELQPVYDNLVMECLPKEGILYIPIIKETTLGGIPRCEVKYLKADSLSFALGFYTYYDLLQSPYLSCTQLFRELVDEKNMQFISFLQANSAKDIGSCFVGGKCYSPVTREECSSLGGTFDEKNILCIPTNKEEEKELIDNAFPLSIGEAFCEAFAGKLSSDNLNKLGKTIISTLGVALNKFKFDAEKLTFDYLKTFSAENCKVNSEKTGTGLLFTFSCEDSGKTNTIKLTVNSPGNNKCDSIDEIRKFIQEIREKGLKAKISFEISPSYKKDIIFLPSLQNNFIEWFDNKNKELNFYVSININTGGYEFYWFPSLQKDTNPLQFTLKVLPVGIITQNFQIGSKQIALVPTLPPIKIPYYYCLANEIENSDLMVSVTNSLKKYFLNALQFYLALNNYQCYEIPNGKCSSGQCTIDSDSSPLDFNKLTINTLKIDCGTKRATFTLELSDPNNYAVCYKLVGGTPKGVVLYEPTSSPEINIDWSKVPYDFEFTKKVSIKLVNAKAAKVAPTTVKFASSPTSPTVAANEACLKTKNTQLKEIYNSIRKIKKSLNELTNEREVKEYLQRLSKISDQLSSVSISIHDPYASLCYSFLQSETDRMFIQLQQKLQELKKIKTIPEILVNLLQNSETMCWNNIILNYYDTSNIKEKMETCLKQHKIMYFTHSGSVSVKGASYSLKAELDLNRCSTLLNDLANTGDLARIDENIKKAIIKNYDCFSSLIALLQNPTEGNVVCLLNKNIKMDPKKFMAFFAYDSNNKPHILYLNISNVGAGEDTKCYIYANKKWQELTEKSKELVFYDSALNKVSVSSIKANVYLVEGSSVSFYKEQEVSAIYSANNNKQIVFAIPVKINNDADCKPVWVIGYLSVKGRENELPTISYVMLDQLPYFFAKADNIKEWGFVYYNRGIPAGYVVLEFQDLLSKYKFLEQKGDKYKICSLTKNNGFPGIIITLNVELSFDQRYKANLDNLIFAVMYEGTRELSLEKDWWNTIIESKGSVFPPEAIFLAVPVLDAPINKLKLEEVKAKGSFTEKLGSFEDTKLNNIIFSFYENYKMGEIYQCSLKAHLRFSYAGQNAGTCSQYILSNERTNTDLTCNKKCCNVFQLYFDNSQCELPDRSYLPLILEEGTFPDITKLLREMRIYNLQSYREFLQSKGETILTNLVPTLSYLPILKKS